MSTIQYHFVSKTASNFNLCVVVHLTLAVFTSMFDNDVSAAIAVMGLVAVLNYNIGLLFLYLLFAPSSLLVDIVRMIILNNHSSMSQGVFGFFVLLRILEIISKILATFFGYQVYTSASSSDSTGYETVNSGPSNAQNYSRPHIQQTMPDPFQPAPYTSPVQQTAPTGYADLSTSQVQTHNQ